MIFLVLTWLVLCTTASAQNTFKLYGTIKSEQTGQIITGASVKILNSDTTTLTNDCGFYSITPPFSRFQLEISSPGKKTKIADIGLFRDQQLDINLKEDTIASKKTKSPIDLSSFDLSRKNQALTKYQRIIINKYLRTQRAILNQSNKRPLRSRL